MAFNKLSMFKRSLPARYPSLIMAREVDMLAETSETIEHLIAVMFATLVSRRTPPHRLFSVAAKIPTAEYVHSLRLTWTYKNIGCTLVESALVSLFAVDHCGKKESDGKYWMLYAISACGFLWSRCS